MTLAERMAVTRNRATGFDYLRIVLATLIIAFHTIAVCYGAAAQHAAFQGPSRVLIATMLPLFFALSGFLVAGSLERTPEIAKFLGLRFIRIFPALVVETILSGFILGPLVTTVPLYQYFTGHKFFAYMYNLLGIPHYALPGVFLTNPFPNTVNAQLWTIPYELQCYIMLAALALFGLAGRRMALFWFALALQLFILVKTISVAHGHFHVLTSAVIGHVLVLTFLAGVVLYALRHRVPWSFPLFVVSAALTLICLAVPLGDYLVPYPAAYVTVYLGLCDPKASALHKLGDLSYGIFLYGFPIQQVVALWGPWTHHWYISLPISLALAVGFAFVSWNAIEKPALRLKSKLGFLQPIDAFIERLRHSGSRGRMRLIIAYNTKTGRQGFVDRTP